MRKTVGIAAALTLAAATLIAAPPATAAPACPELPGGNPILIADVATWVESIIVDQQGRLFGTELNAGKVFRIDHPGAAPVVIASGITEPGGIVVRPDGMLLVGTDNVGVIAQDAQILLMNPDTGAYTTYAQGLPGIDGLALAPDGTVYTSNFGGTDISRVTPDGQVDVGWAHIVSPNGLAVSPDDTYLYADQTALAPTLYRIPIANPSAPQAWITAAPTDAIAAPDGLTLDPDGRPLISTHVSGQIWRAQNGALCSVQSGEYGTPQITYGHSTQGLSAGRLFRAGIDGTIDEIPAGFVSAG